MLGLDGEQMSEAPCAVCKCSVQCALGCKVSLLGTRPVGCNNRGVFAHRTKT